MSRVKAESTMASLTAERAGFAPIAGKKRSKNHRKSGLLLALVRPLLRRPGRTLLVGLALGAGGTILANALFFQKARHPSPFLAAPRGAESRTAAASGPNAPRAETVAAATPPARPESLESLIRETAIARPPATVPQAGAPARQTVREAAPTPREAPRIKDNATREAAPRDPIAELIMKGDARPPADVGHGEAKRLVTSAQKALTKLGYGQPGSEGQLDEATKASIARFEKDRKLTVTRDLSPRTVRELAQASGMRIE